MWFSVSLLMKGDSPNRANSHILWEESIVLVDAGSEEEAIHLGEQLAKESEHQYTSATGDTICWTFHQVERAYQLEEDTFRTGTELFSRFLRTSEVESLLTPFDDSESVG
jgi:hypothetical protein